MSSCFATNWHELFYTRYYFNENCINKYYKSIESPFLLSCVGASDFYIKKSHKFVINWEKYFNFSTFKWIFYLFFMLTPEKFPVNAALVLYVEIKIHPGRVSTDDDHLNFIGGEWWMSWKLIVRMRVLVVKMYMVVSVKDL